MHACLRAGVKMGDKVLVCGAGWSSGNHIYGAANAITTYICGNGPNYKMGIEILVVKLIFCMTWNFDLSHV